MKNAKNRIVENPTNTIIVVVSIAAFIIGIYAVGFWLSLICVGGLNAICFWKQITDCIKLLTKKLKKADKQKKEKNKILKKHTKEPIYEYKVDNSIVTIKDNDMKKKNKNKTAKPKRAKKWIVRILQCLILLGCIMFISAIGFALWFANYIVKNAPEFDPEALYSTEPSVIYYANGEVMATIGTQKRVILTYDEIPEVMINALIATEDANFFQHNGVDLKRFLWASFQQALGKKEAGGASTLTMQLSKNYVTRDKTSQGWSGIVRKFTDVYMAIFKIEPTYTKEEILAFYINSSQVGSAYGIEAAARMYFDKSARDINVSEAALLAGMYQAPHALNPFLYPEAAEKRRKTVLALMLRHGYLNEEEYRIALKLTVDKIVTTSSDYTGSDEMDDRVRSAVDTVVKEVKEKTGHDPRLVSMKIYTTFDKNMQLHVGNVMTGRERNYVWENDRVQAGVIVIDVKTGGIVAIGGNRNNSDDGVFNHATEINYQIGSSSKPLFDYAPAIEYLNWSTGTALADENIKYSDGTSIQNWDGKYIGFNTIRTHLVQSRNIPALKTFQAVDKGRLRSFVTRLGLSPEAGFLHEAHAIGGYNGESPLSMAAAYAAFANGGYYTKPFSFTKIVYTDSGETYTNRSSTVQAMSDSTAYMITSMLQDTVAYGISVRTYRPVNGIRYAGKTGTSNFDAATKKANNLPSNAINDYWMIGYNTEYSIGVWYGYDSIKHGYNKFGSNENGRLFQAIAVGVFKGGTDNWKMPSSVVKVTIETECATLMLPSQFTPNAYKREELFVKGTEPVTVSTRFARLPDVTNLQAYGSYGAITLTWTPIETPDAFNPTILRELNKSAYQNEGGLNGYVDYMINRNKSILGTVGYNVYAETPEGLILIGWTSNPSYVITEYYGSNTFVVKTAYSNFKENMSAGKRITVN